MELIFLGVGNAFTTKDFYQSNMVLKDGNDLCLIDCGSDLRFSLQEQFPFINNGNLHEYIKGIYVSHIHQDHVGGLEWVGFCTYFNPNASRPRLIFDKELKEELWAETLKGGMKSVECEQEKDIGDYFDCVLVDSNKKLGFKFKGVRLEPVDVIHVPSIPPKHSYGLFIEGDKSIYITTDCVFNGEDNKYYHEADLIFHDCETSDFKSNVHSHYNDLKTLPEEIKNKMWLYHYMPDATEKFNPKNDGFLGFVKKGQKFNIQG